MMLTFVFFCGSGPMHLRNPIQAQYLTLPGPVMAHSLLGLVGMVK